jgi:hypothetical protein
MSYLQRLQLILHLALLPSFSLALNVSLFHLGSYVTHRSFHIPSAISFHLPPHGLVTKGELDLARNAPSIYPSTTPITSAWSASALCPGSHKCIYVAVGRHLHPHMDQALSTRAYLSCPSLQLVVLGYFSSVGRCRHFLPFLDLGILCLARTRFPPNVLSLLGDRGRAVLGFSIIYSRRYALVSTFAPYFLFLFSSVSSIARSGIHILYSPLHCRIRRLSPTHLLSLLSQYTRNLCVRPF